MIRMIATHGTGDACTGMHRHAPACTGAGASGSTPGTSIAQHSGYTGTLYGSTEYVSHRAAPATPHPTGSATQLCPPCATEPTLTPSSSSTCGRSTSRRTLLSPALPPRSIALLRGTQRVAELPHGTSTVTPAGVALTLMAPRIVGT